MSTVSAERPVVAAALRQSWRELPVRSWMLVTLGVCVVIFAVSFTGVRQGLSDRRLARDGVRVIASIDAIDGASRNVSLSVPREVTLSYLMPGEAERREIPKAKLTAVQGKVINRHDTIPLRIDPADRRRWTDRVDPAPWLTTLLVPLLLAPFAIVLGLFARRARRGFLRLYERGAPREATVVDVHKSALVPGGKVVKLSLVGGDGRIFTTTHPDALGPLTVGERVEAIVDDAEKPERAILRRTYSGNAECRMPNAE